MGWLLLNNFAFAKAVGALIELQDGLASGRALPELLSARLLALERGLRLQRSLEVQYGIQHLRALKAMVRAAAGAGRFSIFGKETDSRRGQ